MKMFCVKIRTGGITSVHELRASGYLAAAAMARALYPGAEIVDVVAA